MENGFAVLLVWNGLMVSKNPRDSSEQVIFLMIEWRVLDKIIICLRLINAALR